MKKQTKIILGIGTAIAAVGLLIYNNKGKKNFANASGGLIPVPNSPKIQMGETKNLTEITGDCEGCSFNIEVSGEVLDTLYPIIERGICWSTSSSPSIADNKVIDYSGSDNFTCEIPNLSDNVMYYIRSYAKDEKQAVGYGTRITYKKTIGVPIVSTLPTNFKVDKSTTLENEFDNSAEYKYSYNGKSYALTTGARVTSVGSCNLSGVGVIYSLTPYPSLVDLEGDNPPKVKYLTDYTPLPPKPIVVKSTVTPPEKPSVSGCFYCEELKNILPSAQNVAYTDCYGVKNSKSLASGSSIMVKSGTLTKGNLTVLRSGTSYTVCDGVPVPVNPANVDTSYSCADAKKMLEAHKAVMAKSRYTEEGMLAAQKKLAELQFAVTKSCGEVTVTPTSTTPTTTTTTTSLPPKIPTTTTQDCFDCQKWGNNTGSTIYGVSFVDCNGNIVSNKSIAPDATIEIKSGTLYYSKNKISNINDLSFNGSNFMNFNKLTLDSISTPVSTELTLISSRKVCIDSRAFDGGFSNSISNNNFLNFNGFDNSVNNFLNATGQPDGTGDYSTELILPLNTTVYIRAFATNQYGTSYGSQVVFKVNAKAKK